MKNTGKEYEALTEQVFARLLAQDNICSKVERDVVLDGRSTKHQIDVTFEFKAGPASYRTIIQCKDWGATVKQEQVLAFHSVLTDIPGQPRGIMVSRSGFQQGARNVADHHGIKLYELREPHDDDWDGLLRALRIHSTIQVPGFRNLSLVLDLDWCRERAWALGIPKGTTLDIVIPPGGLRGAVFESGRACDMETLTRSAVPSEPSDWQPFQLLFEEAILVRTPDFPLPQVRVTGLKGDARLKVVEDSIEVRLDHLVAYCFRDVLAGDRHFLKADGSPILDEGEGASS